MLSTPRFISYNEVFVITFQSIYAKQNQNISPVSFIKWGELLKEKASFISPILTLLWKTFEIIFNLHQQQLVLLGECLIKVNLMRHTLEYMNIQLCHKFPAYRICLTNSSMVKNLHFKECKIKSTWEHKCSVKGAVGFCLLNLKHLELFASRHLWKHWPMIQREQIIKDPNRNLP